MVCEAWAVQGYGTPPVIYAVHVVKIALYVGAWLVFCSTSPGLGGLTSIGQWWLSPIAFEKAILWSMLFEGLGLGCGFGPLTGRYFPPIGGVLYFVRPGTTKQAVFPRLPVLGGTRRTWLDVGLYVALLALVLRALIAPAPGVSHLLPIAVLVPVLGLADRTIFLALRAEHYWTTIVCLAVGGNWIAWIAGAKAVQLALWFWAGISKLNHHFPAVVCVMISNSPVVRWPWFRKKLYMHYPEDLRPSMVAVVMSHMGTVLELGVPIVLGIGSGGTTTMIGLVMMLLLHSFITGSVPMGVPIEWNVIMVYGGFFLFGANASVSILSLGSPALYMFLFAVLVALPILGNLFPSRISFLLAMRYYAGNWAYSVWFFKGESYRKLDRLTKTSPWILDQLAHFYDRKTSVGLLGKVIGFRAMHLHGRALQALVPK